MKPAPRIPQKVGKSPFAPSAPMLERMSEGTCAQERCGGPLEVQYTSQLRYDTEVHVWGFCEPCARVWLDLFVQAHCYWLGIEQWGTYQPSLPFFEEAPTETIQ